MEPPPSDATQSLIRHPVAYEGSFHLPMNILKVSQEAGLYLKQALNG
jgi:hypothetical protein